ncbi:MAG: 6,7-dimethyl-8-ribityllumazine synthase [Chloroflexi bacterium]|nr:MAG: 6,7-dimethyl-8-ribityllumazine synthase [Chloroflexota bacterium]TMG35685.1 MAG: 6,7-dimethyl-8-ribityllumazine synthase [Chloroflexota bacterium]
MTKVSGSRVAIVRARWNDDITRALEEGALERARATGASVDRFEVPGSFELAPAVATLAGTGRYDAVVPIGCLLRGETPHFEVLAHAVARALAELAVSSEVAIPFGVLTCDTAEQAWERAGGAAGNKGAEFMDAALELVALRQAIAASSSRSARSAASARSRSTRAKRRTSPGRR